MGRKALRIFVILLLLVQTACKQEKQDVSWPIYRGDEGSNGWSSLTQINRQNVKRLEPAWIYRSGPYSDNTTLECNPLIVGNVLFGLSPTVKVFALEANTGKKLWVFNPYPEDHRSGGFYRGITYRKEGEDERIITFAGNRMIALDARTGKVIASFGEKGTVDLNRKLVFIDGIEQKAEVRNTSPGMIYKDLIVVGSVIAEDYDASPGHIRAFDVRTGELRWTFHTIPQSGEYGYETWENGNGTSGGCNAWSGFSLDSKRGIVFAATGSPTFDFHGGERHGANLFGNSVIALDANTGKRIWHYQLVHHDLWDYDLPAPPNLVTLKINEKDVDAVVQLTKQGFVFVFERATGKPLFDINEVPVPLSKMPDEKSYPTQPVPVLPPPLATTSFDKETITNISAESEEFVEKLTRDFDRGSIFLPPSRKGIVQMPGMRGGAEWSGGCVDLTTGIMYVGINNVANIVEVEEQKEYNRSALEAKPLFDAGKSMYAVNCAACHGQDREGGNGFPALRGIEKRLSAAHVENILNNPGGRMPSFAFMPAGDKEAIIAYLLGKREGVYHANHSEDRAAVPRKKRFVMKGYNFLKDQDGYPGTRPPWGTLNAVDLNTGAVLWTRPLGSYATLDARGIPPTGTQLFGGGIVTAGGLIFMGASADEKFRAIDKVNGDVLWEFQLPCGGYATPSTYAVNGKQFIVIAAGGGGSQATKGGDYYFAFALPE